MKCAPLQLALGGIALVVAACVPADEALGLGSVQFTFTASSHTKNDIYPGETQGPNDGGGYRVHFDRVILSFRTMTVGKLGAPDTCSYRGRGAVSDAVFRPLGAKTGLVQTFNGMSPVECPDVGVIFDAPTDTTVVDANATPQDLIELAQGGLHAIIDVTATPTDELPSNPIAVPTRPTKIQLRFNPITTSTRFGGCREATRGTRIRQGNRDEATVYFAAENLFRGAISSTYPFRIRPFIQADERGNGDGVATMEEVDNMPLSAIPDNDLYQVPSSTSANNVQGRFPSLGDFVRFLFRFTLLYRTENGLCTGNEPGSDSEE
jgi:hypothetical protein